MRFTKQEILKALDREDRSYRLALLSSHWLRDAARYKPSAAEEARGMRMEAYGKRISFADLADALEHPNTREIVSSDFVLTQLHTLIRVPFEVLSDYCKDFDGQFPGQQLCATLKGTKWYWFAYIVRNAVSHNFRYDFRGGVRKQLPICWNGITLTAEMQGQPVTYETLWHRRGYELFLEMRRFAESLPERR
jgi:hypothetical protein